jgi:quinol monooxygenase YgiN
MPLITHNSRHKNHKAFNFMSMLLMLILVSHAAVSQQQNWVVRLAKIEIDSVYLKDYQAAIKEHTRAALATEPGVLTLYAMYEKANPTHVTVLEIYADKAAYESHIKTAHFLKYKNGTLKMVRSLKLIDVDPIALGVKPGLLKLLQE